MAKRWIKKTGIILFWLLLWQLASIILNQPIVLAGPDKVIRALFLLIPQGEFWLTVAMTLMKIFLGFAGALAAGFCLGALSWRLGVLKEFLAPVMSLMKSIPVASFVILALLWAGSENLSVLISFLVALPMMYVHTLAGLSQTDQKLLEMSAVFGMSFRNKCRYIYWSGLKSHMKEGIRVTVGFCWKSGVAAEVIGVPAHSIGEKLYMAKIYLSTDELLAWTLVVILLSALFEKICLWLLGRGEHHGNSR